MPTPVRAPTELAFARRRHSPRRASRARRRAQARRSESTFARSVSVGAGADVGVEALEAHRWRRGLTGCCPRDTQGEPRGVRDATPVAPARTVPPDDVDMSPRPVFCIVSRASVTAHTAQRSPAKDSLCATVYEPAGPSVSRAASRLASAARCHSHTPRRRRNKCRRRRERFLAAETKLKRK